MLDDHEELRRDCYDHVWDALEDTPELAADMRLRSDLISIQEEVNGWGLTQTTTADRLSIPQSRLNDLLRSRITTFTSDELAKLAACAGLQVRVEVGQATPSFE